MYACRRFPGLVVVAVFAFFGANVSLSAQAQTTPAAEQHEQGTQTPADGEEHAGHDMASMVREASGTAWLPDASPMYAIHADRHGWELMAHENLFVQFLHESGDRGDDQFGSINWIMGMAQRRVGAGRVTFRGMFSLEPWTIRGCGYPDLLASGERCRGKAIHDHQHPHDLVMEASAAYDAPVTGSLRWQVYGGPAGEPALGPVAYPHRVSAMPNPLAPIAHHWLDSTHVTFGVATAGVYGNHWKAEASVFNGREPDEQRKDLDFGALDSVSGRLWFLPASNWSLQVSLGKLTDAEPSESGGPGSDITRATASGTYHRSLGEKSILAATIAWGRNAESNTGSNAVLLETNVTLNDRDTWFGRFEAVGKTAHDLAIEAEPSGSRIPDPGSRIEGAFTVAKLQGGYTRYLSAWNGLQPGVGGALSFGIVPERLTRLYGSRVNMGFGVYVTLRPAVMTMLHGAGPAGSATTDAGQTMVMVQTAYDPAKLSCSPPIDVKTAAKTTYQGKTYFFCSAKDRDEFLKNPAMSLSMMPPKQ